MRKPKTLEERIEALRVSGPVTFTRDDWAKEILEEVDKLREELEWHRWLNEFLQLAAKTGLPDDKVHWDRDCLKQEWFHGHPDEIRATPDEALEEEVYALKTMA